MMTGHLEIFLSNRLEILYQQLKRSLFGPSTKPLMRRIVVVSGPAMKNWLTLRMAQDPELHVAMGIEFVYLNQAIEFLLKLAAKEGECHFPSILEISFAIESEIHRLVQNYPLLIEDEQADWRTLIHYLKLDLGTPEILSRKTERRLIGLSDQLAGLFHDYGRYAKEMTTQWDREDTKGWQPRLWRRLFVNTKWGYPCRDLDGQLNPEEFTVSFFSISFLSSSEFAFLNRLSQHLAVQYYLISPCAVFWSDIRSDRESAYLEQYWQKRVGIDSSQLQTLEELLRDRNPLLANFGGIGREMACRIEESQARTHALYALPEQVRELHADFPPQDDMILTRSESPLTLLHVLQADLLLMRNPQKNNVFNFDHEDRSIQLHAAPCKRREVEILYHNILRMMLDNPSLCPADVLVMAPQIDEYAPYIRSIFGTEDSQLDFQILDVDMRRQNDLLQGYFLLLNLSEGRWNAREIMQLFSHVSFQRRHQLTLADCNSIRDWIEEVGIHWGDDDVHREEVLRRKHFDPGGMKNTLLGTWDYGLSRLMLGLAVAQESFFGIPPSPSLVFSEGELLGKWVRLMHALRDDVAPLHDGSRMTLSDWVDYLLCLLETYFACDREERQSKADFEDVKAKLNALRTTSSIIRDVPLSFVSIKTRLVALFDTGRGISREDHVQAVHFCSLIPLRSIPARAIALLGMQEEAFPRISVPLSLDQLARERTKEYYPTTSDFDRYHFLESLHSAQDYLIISYCSYSQKDSKESNPSLVVEELFSYLDRVYTIRGKKVSDTPFIDILSMSSIRAISILGLESITFPCKRMTLLRKWRHLIDQAFHPLSDSWIASVLIFRNSFLRRAI